MSQTKRLDNLINYQEGVVASRTLIDKPAGTVTLFAFDKGQGLSEHTAPYDAMVYIVNGKADITVSGKLFNLEKGDTITMPANKSHKVYAKEQFKIILIMIKSK